MKIKTVFGLMLALVLALAPFQALAALVLPNQGEQLALEAMVGKTAGQNLVLRLYTNNYTPVEGTTEASVTEASGNGYSAITLTAANWSFAAGDPSTLSYAEQTFTFTGALGNVYGYYFTQVTSGKLVWAEKFTNGPYNIQNNGDQIKITPAITLE
jgi:hypothetical protein